MSYASKPGTPRLLSTQPVFATPGALPRASFNGVEFPVKPAAQPAPRVLEQPKPAPKKTK